MKGSERLYRWLLRLYPRDFRDEYGHEMSLLFRARAIDGPVRLWLQVLGDLVFHAPKEHWIMMKQDLRYAVRTLLRAPTFAVTVIATLTLGIGANSVIFSAVDPVLLRDAPVSDPDSRCRLLLDLRVLSPGDWFLRRGDAPTDIEASVIQTRSSADQFPRRSNRLPARRGDRRELRGQKARAIGGCAWRSRLRGAQHDLDGLTGE